MTRAPLVLPAKPPTESDEDFFSQSPGDIVTIWDGGATSWDTGSTVFDPRPAPATEAKGAFDHFARLGATQGGSVWDDGASIWDGGASIWD